MIDLSALTDTELKRLATDVIRALRNREPDAPSFNLQDSIIIESRSFVDPNTLVPTFEIKLSINKESVHDFISAWTYYYEKLAKFDQLTEHFSPKKQAEHDIRKQIETKFNSYLWSDVTL